MIINLFGLKVNPAKYNSDDLQKYTVNTTGLTFNTIRNLILRKTNMIGWDTHIETIMLSVRLLLEEEKTDKVFKESIKKVNKVIKKKQKVEQLKLF